MDEMNESLIHNFYDQFQKMRAKKVSSIEERAPRGRGMEAFEKLDRTSLGAGPNTSSRHLDPSFRAVHFDIGEGKVTIAPNTTTILARWDLPATHAGVLRGFTQHFVVVSDEEDIVWGLRINGQRIHGFSDFVGALSTPSFIRPVRYLLAGLDTLGTRSVSPGSSTVPGAIPAVAFQATNIGSTDVQLRGRIIGYSFPVDELVDNFHSF